MPGMPEGLSGLGDEWFPAETGIYFLSHANRKTVINLFDLFAKGKRGRSMRSKSPPPNGSAAYLFRRTASSCSSRRSISPPPTSC